MSDTLVGHTHEEVLHSFNNLRESYESDNMVNCNNYITIRLVTLIEQFCRVTYKQLKPEYDKKNKRYIAVQILIDIFKKFDPNIKPDECDIKIRQWYRNRNGKDHDKDNDNSRNEGADGSIQLNYNETQKLVEIVLKKQNLEAVEWILLYMLSFQSVKNIKNMLGVSFTTEQHKKLNNLFGSRHAVVHTISDRRACENMFIMVKLLFDQIDDVTTNRSL